MPLTSAWASRSRDRPAAPFRRLLLGHRVGAAEALGEGDEVFGGVVVAVEDDGVAGGAKLGLDLVIDVELAGVDDRHVEPGGDGVVEEHAVHRAAHGFVAAEREGQVRQAARDVRVGTADADFAARLDEVDRIAAMLVDPGGDGEDVGVEDDVLGREAVGDEQVVGAAADFDLALLGVGLADFVERHDDDRGAVAADLGGDFEERRFAFLHADRIDDRLARDALEPGLDHAPLRAVDHHRHARDVGLGGEALQIGRHGEFAVEQSLVHVDVDDLRAGLDLLQGHGNRGVIVAGEDQFLELGRAGDVGPLADVDEAGGVDAI